MDNTLNFGVKWSLIAFSVLLCVAQTAHAQERSPLPDGKNSTASRGLLGRSQQELLTRYGKPTAICFLVDSPPNKVVVPEGVATFSPQTTPKWAQSVAFQLQGQPEKMVWFYKRNDKAVSYLIDRLGYIEAACLVGTVAPVNTKSQEFEVSALPSASLGAAASDVIKRYGYPDEVRTVATDIDELVYLSEDKEPTDIEAFATKFTIFNGKVVRLYSYSYLPKPSSSKSTPDVWGGKFSLLRPR